MSKAAVWIHTTVGFFMPEPILKCARVNMSVYNAIGSSSHHSPKDPPPPQMTAHMPCLPQSPTPSECCCMRCVTPLLLSRSSQERGPSPCTDEVSWYMLCSQMLDHRAQPWGTVMRWVFCCSWSAERHVWHVACVAADLCFKLLHFVASGNFIHSCLFVSHDDAFVKHLQFEMPVIGT